jgi:hypothetical protein
VQRELAEADLHVVPVLTVEPLAVLERLRRRREPLDPPDQLGRGVPDRPQRAATPGSRSLMITERVRSSSDPSTRQPTAPPPKNGSQKQS